MSAATDVGPRDPPARPGRTWTFLSNHGHVLVQVSRDPQARLRDLAEVVGITERSAQAILADLEEGGYVTKARVGRRNSYQVHPELAFRHPAEADRPIGSLIQIFLGEANEPASSSFQAEEIATPHASGAPSR